MKLTSFVVVVCLLCSLLGSCCPLLNVEPEDPNIAHKNSSFDYAFNANGTLDHHEETDNIVIYGNYKDFDSSLLYSLIHDKDKICIFYDLDLSDNVNDSHEIMRNNAVIYYYKNDIPHIHSYVSSSSDTKSLITDVNNYVNNILLKISKGLDRVNTAALAHSEQYTSDSEDFVAVRLGSFKEEEKPYGYIECDYVIKKYKSNDVSLYIVEARFFFTPGRIANNLGDGEYDNWFNSSGYAKIKAKRADGEVGFNLYGRGGAPIFKDAYPVNQAFQNSNVALSAQKDPADVEKYTWLYTYEYPKAETYNLVAGYIFETSNPSDDLPEYNISLEFEYRMTVENDLRIFKKSKTFIGHTCHNYY